MTTEIADNSQKATTKSKQDELKSRLRVMSEVEVKITTSSMNGGGLTSSKKSRKNKTPVFRQQQQQQQQRRASSDQDQTTSGGPVSPIKPEQRASSSPETAVTASMEAKKPPTSVLINEPPLPAPPGGITSYSDFMRSLAAKYNNNDYFTPTSNGLPAARPSGLESPFQPFKTSSAPTPNSTISNAVHPLLGLPNPFQFGALGAAHGLSSLAGLHAHNQSTKDENRANKGQGQRPTVGLPPGFPSMMDLHSTQAALLSLARNGGLLPQPPTTSSAFSPAEVVVKATKRPAVSETGALDLSGPPLKKANILSPTKASVDPTILNWSVSDVANFVGTIDICREYSEVFREHNIDGSSLPLLTEDHLTLRLGLKLGPALKLRSIIARKLGPAHADICVHCAHCNTKAANQEQEFTNSNGINQSDDRSASRNSSLSS